MEATQIAKQLIDFQKSYITSAIDASKLFQNQTQKTMENILKQTAIIPEVFQKTFTIWADTTQKNVEGIVAAMEKSVKN
jgi:hypothetical protein